MAFNIEGIEDGVPTHEENRTTLQHMKSPLSSLKSIITKWWLLLINAALLAVGTIGGPLLLRLYFLHGGSRRWIPGLLLTAGFPILLVPISILYVRQGPPQNGKFFASPKLLLCGVFIGVLTGIDTFMYSLGLSYIPVSTSSLLLSTQLVFTAVFAFIIVRHKFTPYSSNAVVLMTLGSILLGISKSGDRPADVTNAQYLLGFIVTLGSAALVGLMFPITEVSYTKEGTALTYSSVLQFQFVAALSATVFSLIGMLINKDFSAMPREASKYELGTAKYYLVLLASAIVWQLLFIGNMGLVFCSSSLTSGVVNATLLPVTEIAAVIVYHEKFNGEKGISLALCIWGFASYFYGSYRATRKQQLGIRASEEETK
ncbi:hypothetical protein Scep_003459 [Stephania cephalantha]|uniref:Probable purine permease n=1 Tax=Stephania cephalantha TaxID=152367 RepID=A0AAP0KT47_9MAGN